jgi:hypothetical protein
MPLNLERLKGVVDAFENVQDETQRARYLECVKIATDALAKDLPALSDLDRAAVAVYISATIATIRDLTVKEVDQVIADTVIGYSLGAAKLVGMLD